MQLINLLLFARTYDFQALQVIEVLKKQEMVPIFWWKGKQRRQLRIGFLGMFSVPTAQLNLQFTGQFSQQKLTKHSVILLCSENI